MIEAVKATAELIKILDDIKGGYGETHSIEFKPSIAFTNHRKNEKLQEVIRAILAMSNIEGWGYHYSGYKRT